MSYMLFINVDVINVLQVSLHKAINGLFHVSHKLSFFVEILYGKLPSNMMGSSAF